jgi:hypothetical protein
MMSERRYAILIASSKYACDPERLPELRCPENDVEALSRLLTSEQHGIFDRPDVLVLRNKPSYEVLRALNRVLKQAGKNELVLIYYSGHGKLDPAGRLHLATGDTLIQELESTSIPVSSVRNYIDISPSNKVILILDCCYSGSVGSAFLKGSVDDQLQQVSDARGIYIITASTAIQVAQERPEDEYSLLTKHLLEGIEEGRADADDDGKITVEDLYSYAYERMKKESFQVPMKWGLNVRGEELVLARTGKLAGAGVRAQADELIKRRRIFYDRRSVSILAGAGASGAAIGLLLVRGLIALLLPEPAMRMRVALSAFWGAILGGSLAYALALDWYVRRAEESGEKITGWWVLLRLSRRKDLGAIIFSTLLFGLTHLLMALAGGLSLTTEPGVLLMSILMGLLAGLGLSVSLVFHSPLTPSNGAAGWLFRLGVAGLTLLLVQLAYILAADKGAGLAIAWGSDFYHYHFLQDNPPRWQQLLSFHLKWYDFLALADAALTGIAITTGVTLGMGKTAQSLNRARALWAEPPR